MKNKNKITQLEVYKKLRKKWNRKPVTMIHLNKRKKSRQQKKIDLKKEVNND